MLFVLCSLLAAQLTATGPLTPWLDPPEAACLLRSSTVRMSVGNRRGPSVWSNVHGLVSWSVEPQAGDSLTDASVSVQWVAIQNAGLVVQDLSLPAAGLAVVAFAFGTLPEVDW